jgi:hypothetical protein
MYPAWEAVINNRQKNAMNVQTQGNYAPVSLCSGESRASCFDRSFLHTAGDMKYTTTSSIQILAL